MCTAIAKIGNDALYGYNLDLDPSVWNYKLKKTSDLFSVTIKVGSSVYYTHGVNSKGQFANLPYMNGEENGSLGVGNNRYRIDLLVDRYIKGKLLFADVLETVKTKQIVNLPDTSMHSLFCDKKGHILLVEPNLGYKEISDDFAVVTNFPILKQPGNFNNPFYGKDRYDKAVEILSKADNSFSVSDALKLLDSVYYREYRNGLFWCKSEQKMAICAKKWCKTM